MAGFISALIDFFYPPYCLLCDNRLDGMEKFICPICWNRLEPAEISEYDLRRTGGWIDQLVSLAAFREKAFFNELEDEIYEPVMQQMLHLLKYGNKRSLGVQLGRKLGQVIRRAEWHEAVNRIIPVPLHSVRYRERGYNQSERIARGVAQVLNIPVDTTSLKRTKMTQSLTHLNAYERQRTVADAFHIANGSDIDGQVVLLVDDVFTTGATLTACARTLKNQGGVAIVMAATVAKTPLTPKEEEDDGKS